MTKSPTAIPYRVVHRKFYDVEIMFRQDGDVIYHFFPQRGMFDFQPNPRIFSLLVEDAYVWAVGVPDVEADYFTKEIAQYFVRAEDPSRPLNQSTLCVTVRKVGDRLAADKILIDRYFGRLDELCGRAMARAVEIGKVRLESELLHHRWRD
jgi:hypothetical protein